MGYTYAWCGRIDEGRQLLTEATEPLRGSPFMSLWIGRLSEVYLLGQRIDDAAVLAERAFDLACGRGERGYQAEARRLLGEIAAHRDPPDAVKASEHYRQALALATELGMRPLAAHCQLGLGQLSRRTGQREQAQEHLTTAATMYREMDMGFWLSQAEAALREVDSGRIGA